MNHINYLAEINGRAAYKPFIATPVDWISRQYNVYYIDLFRPENRTYWEDWGGWYDTLETRRVEIYITDWLQKALNLQDVINTPYLFYVDAAAGLLYFNVPMHPWLYANRDLQLVFIRGFLHTVKDPQNPSDCYIENDYLPATLGKPSDDRKLSDPLHGAQLYLTFNISIQNDGGFDLIDPVMYFNGPARLYKSIKENPAYDDFVMIRTGVVESVSVDDKTASFSCAEKFRSLNQNVCDTLTAADFNITPIEGVEGKSLPVAFGEVEINLIKVFEYDEDNAAYICAEYISAVRGVYDGDGNALPYIRNGLTIAASKNAAYARIAGYTENRIGYVVIQILKEKADIPYIASFWDIAETNAYRESSPRINIVLTGGAVKNAICDVIKSDLVFLIQKNNALFTLRSWGGQYGVHQLEAWTVTQQPKINWNDAQKYYFSSCVVKYQKNARTGDFLSYYNDENEDAALEKYNKPATGEFETCLASAADARALSVKLAARFSTLKAQAVLGIGTDTSGINLLDAVLITIDINGRIYSKNNIWRVAGINPAQDVLTLVED